MIHTAESHFGVENNAAEFSPAAFWGRKDVPPFLPDKHSDYTLHAFVNHGRWLVQCPICNGAQFASKNDPRFFCVGCLNEHIGHRWARVVWPKRVDDIEAVLLRRPIPDTRNWVPGERVSTLEQENSFHKVA